MSSTRRAVAVGALCALVACRTVPSRPDQSAVLARPTAQSRHELERAVGSALGNRHVVLADDALTRESTLIIEHARPRDGQGYLMDGRERREPEHFRLVTAGSQCVLIHEETGRRFLLREVVCSPL